MRLEDLIHRLDVDLHRHFLNEGIQYMQFSFRWMNCILLRELPLRAIMRVWDTYLSEEEGGFENFHVYVCAVFLKTYRETLLNMQVGNADKNFIIAPHNDKKTCVNVYLTSSVVSRDSHVPSRLAYFGLDGRANGANTIPSIHTQYTF